MALLCRLFIFLIFSISCAQKTEKDILKVATSAYHKHCHLPIKFPANLSPQSGQVPAVSRVEPEYPQPAMKNHIEACVVLLFDINEEGKARDIRLFKSYPRGWGFEDSAVKALTQWEFPEKAKKNASAQLEFLLH